MPSLPNQFHAYLAAFAARESPELLDQLDAVLDNPTLQYLPTLASIQDEIGVANARAQAIKELLDRAGPRSPQETLEALRIARAAADAVRSEAPTVEIAWTHPGPVEPRLRRTASIAREIIEGAQQTLLVVGYSVSVDRDLAGLAAQTIASLAKAAERDVQVTAILHDIRRNGAALLAAWPSDRPPPSFFTWPARAETPMASLHAKVVTADSHRALITSANLTFHGFEANVEIGVQITGDGARRLEAVFKELIHQRGFIPWTP